MKKLILCKNDGEMLFLLCQFSEFRSFWLINRQEIIYIKILAQVQYNFGANAQILETI